MKDINSKENQEELNWVAPEYELMIPKLEEAHVEINQLRYAIEKGGLKLTEEVLRHGNDTPTDQLSEIEVKAILGMLIQQGNKRLQEISDIKSYLEVVKTDNMVKIKSGYIDNYDQYDTHGHFKFIWSPSGIKADSFLMAGKIDKDGFIYCNPESDDMDESMLNSIDFKEIETIIINGEL